MQRLVSLFFKIGSLNKLKREILKTDLSLTSSFVRFLSSPKKGKIKIIIKKEFSVFCIRESNNTLEKKQILSKVPSR